MTDRRRLVFGLQPVREVLKARASDVIEVLVEDRPNPKLEGLMRLAVSREAPIRRVSVGELDRLSKGGRHQGTLAVARELPILDEHEMLAAMDAAEPGEAPLVLALDGIMDPQNFGAAVRSAVALGASHVVWPEHASAPLSPAMFRASAGAVEHARLVRVRALPSLLHELGTRAFEVVVLDPQGTVLLSDIDLTLPTALVIGSEDKGSRGPVRRAATRLARLPITDTVDSLNASVAAAVALYEATRQRMQRDKPQ